MSERQRKDQPEKVCGKCVLCTHTYLGPECGLTDNPVEDNREDCIDYIPEDSDF